MDLAKILEGIENKDELIKQINAEVGREFVPRSEFNSKNSEVKELQKQLGEMSTNYEGMAKSKADWDKQIAELNAQVTSYQTAALKSKIAHEVGIPYELASRLSGEDEKSLRADAEVLAGFIKSQQPQQPLKSTEPASVGSDANSGYKTLLENINLND